MDTLTVLCLLTPSCERQRARLQPHELQWPICSSEPHQHGSFPAEQKHPRRAELLETLWSPQHSRAPVKATQILTLAHFSALRRRPSFVAPVVSDGCELQRSPTSPEASAQIADCVESPGTRTLPWKQGIEQEPRDEGPSLSHLLTCC